MTSAALGIGYSLWLRVRWAIGATLTLYLVLALVPQFFPAMAPYCCGASIAILFMVMVPLLNTFSYGPADLGVKSSGFPPHMRTLPISTRAMVGWPMLLAAVIFALLWMLPACFIFLPAGIQIPVFWPAAMFAAICLWVQAVGWSPFPSPFARVPILLIAIVPLTVPLAFGITFLEGTTQSTLLFVCGLIWSAAAYAFGVRGLSRARTGCEGDWFRPIAERWAARGRRQYAIGNRRRPFRSPFAAQLWHECRRNAIVLPIMIGFVGLPMLVALCLPVLNPRATPDAFVFGSTVLPPHMIMLLIWIALPSFFALTQGASMAKCDVWGIIPMPAFFATRPMTTTQFLLIKLCSTAFSVISVWVITFSLFALWAALEASTLNTHKSIVRAALVEATPRTIAISISFLVGLVVVTWRNMVSGMWPTLTGRKRFSIAIGFAFMAAYSAVGGALSWTYQHQAYHALFWRVLPWIVGGLIGLKLFVAVWLSLRLQKRGLIRPSTLRLLAVGWLVLAGSLMAGVSLVITPTWALAAIVVMSLPFPSLAAMPLALDWNRHR
jgi:hypothetical protein